MPHRGSTGIILVETLFLLSLVLLIVGSVAVHTGMTIKNAKNRLELLKRVTVAENYHRYLKIALVQETRGQWTKLWLQELEKITVTQRTSMQAAAAQVTFTEAEGRDATEKSSALSGLQTQYMDVRKTNRIIQRWVKMKVFSQLPDEKQALLLSSELLAVLPETLVRIEFLGWEEIGDEKGRVIRAAQAHDIDPEALSLLVDLYFRDRKGLWKGNSFYRFRFPNLSESQILDLQKDPERRQELLLEYSKAIDIQATGITIKKIR